MVDASFRVFSVPGVVTDFHQTHSPSCDLGINDLRSDRTHCSHFLNVRASYDNMYSQIVLLNINRTVNRGNFLDSSRKTN
jgi:hypothetical protein